nr:MAG TPA: hypothetical protein [Bacteriophage sp.]
MMRPGKQAVMRLTARSRCAQSSTCAVLFV